MFCLIALIILSILGIFSATHRQLAKEAFNCVFKKITLRPCNTGFDQKIKGKIVGKLLGKSVLAARLLNKHFELVSWIFFMLLISSSFWVVKGGYNFYMYGSCNGLNQTGFCLFDPIGENNKISQINDTCSLEERSEKNLKLGEVRLNEFPTKNTGAKDVVVFIGCYTCDYSRKAYPLIQKLITKNKTSYTFIHFPVKEETDYLSNYVYCAYNQNQEKFWGFNDKLFSSGKEDVASSKYVDEVALEAGFDKTKLRECVSSEKTKKIVDEQLEQIQNTGIYGTPTIFINNKALVGPKPYRVYQRALGRLMLP